MSPFLTISHALPDISITMKTGQVQTARLVLLSYDGAMGQLKPVPVISMALIRVDPHRQIKPEKRIKIW